MFDFIPISYIHGEIQIVSTQICYAQWRCFILFLIYFGYPLDFSDSQVLTSSQNEFVKETETKVYRLLEETPPNGKAFAQTVRHMLKREELWNNWKNEGCKGKKEKWNIFINIHRMYTD